MRVLLALLMTATAWAASIDEIQGAIDEARTAGGGRVCVPQGKYYLSAPLNLRDCVNVTLDCEPGTLLVARYPETGAAWPVVDMTGAYRTTLVGCRVYNDRAYQWPACGVLLARSQTKAPNFNALRDVVVDGFFTKASIVNVGSECFHITRCDVRHHGETGCALYLGRWNELGIASPHGPVLYDSTSMAGGTVDGSTHLSIYGEGDRTRRCIVWLADGAHSVFLRDFYTTGKDDIDAVFWLGSQGREPVWNVHVGPWHDECWDAANLVRVLTQTQGCTIGGALVRCGQLTSFVPTNHNYADGLSIREVVHRPHRDYWIGQPVPVAAPGNNQDGTE